MSSAALADLTSTTSTTPKSRREKAANTVDKALRGGIVTGAVAAIAWLLASAIGATIFFLLIIVTVAALLYTVMRGDKARLGVWAVLAVAWALVLAERWVVNDHGGLIVAGAAWLGVVMGARRAGIAKKSLILLAYPLISVAICIGADTSVADPWGISWLWVAAILGPVVGLRTVLNPSPRDHTPEKPAI